MNPNPPLLFAVATHLQGATVTAATVVPMGRSVLYLWAFANPEGQENTLVIQQRERQWVRWKVFPGHPGRCRAALSSAAAGTLSLVFFRFAKPLTSA